MRYHRATGWRSFRAAVVLGLLAILALGAIAPISAAKAAEPKPTIVLVHGAWAGPGAWAEVSDALERDGYDTVAPRLDLLGIASDVAILRAALDAIDGDKILVGHSYGGIVISNAAYGRSDVLGLVFTAAFVPDEGDSILSLGEGFPPSEVLQHLDWLGEPFASLALIDRETFPEIFAGDLSPKKAEVLNAGQQATSPAVLVTPSGPVAWHTLPSWYAVSGADRVIGLEEQRWMAERAGATTVEFEDASHVGGFTHYASRLTKLIQAAARATSD